MGVADPEITTASMEPHTIKRALAGVSIAVILALDLLPLGALVAAEIPTIKPTHTEPTMATQPPQSAQVDVSLASVAVTPTPESQTRVLRRHIPQSASTPAESSRYSLMSQAGIPVGQQSCAYTLIARESGWRTQAVNLSSGAYGLPQSLPGNKMASAGADWETNPVTQLRWMVTYVNGRYGGFCQALEHSNTKNWY